MASSISSLSYLDPSAYQSPVSTAATTPATAPGAGVSATAEVKAIEQQGNFKSFFNDSLAAALLQPATGVNSGTPATTLINNMLQEVLGAYQAQTNSS